MFKAKLTLSIWFLITAHFRLSLPHPHRSVRLTTPVMLRWSVGNLSSPPNGSVQDSRQSVTRILALSLREAINTTLTSSVAQRTPPPWWVGSESPHPPPIQWLTTTSFLERILLTVSLSATPLATIPLHSFQVTTPLPVPAALMSSIWGQATTS